MKRFGHVYEVVCDRENLRAAYLRARQGKRAAGGVIAFEANLGQNLARLQRELVDETYRPGAYRVFLIKEPKERLIMALPFRDRVVQHSICDFVLEPILDRHLIADTCACRHGMGTHYALGLLKNQMIRISREHPGAALYCLKGDIDKFFYSIDHRTLKQRLRHLIKDPKLLRLLDLIIDSGDNVAMQERTRLGLPCRGAGLPLGNLASQLFANYYLSDMDHMIKERLQIKHYIRYMDDFTLLHHDKEYLKHCRVEIECHLAGIRLKLNPKTQIFPLRQGVDFLGFHTYLTETGKVIRKLRRDSVRRMKRKIKHFKREFARGEMLCGERVRQCLASWSGHAGHGNTYNLRRKLFGKLILRRNEE